MTERPGFYPDEDYPYPEDEFERAAVDRLWHRWSLVDKIVSVASWLRLFPYDPETGAIRSAFDEIWRSATESYSINDGPETWTFHSGRTAAYPSEDCEGWHDLPTFDLSAMRSWKKMWLPKVLTPGKQYACTRCTFTTCREDRAREHDRNNHPGENIEPGTPVTSSPHFDVVDEDTVRRAPRDAYSGEGQHSLADFGRSA